MKFYRLRLAGNKPGSNFMQLLFYPMGFTFKYGNTGKHKVPLLRISDTSRVIGV
jgi:hypothetical protein